MKSRFKGYEIVFVLMNWEAHFEVYFKDEKFHVYDVAAEAWFVGIFDDRPGAIDHCLKIMGVYPTPA